MSEYCTREDLKKLVPTPAEFEATFNACFAEFERIINQDIVLDMVVIPPSTFPSIRYAVTGERTNEQRELKRVLAACGALLASFHWRNGRKRKRMRILATKVIASYPPKH